MADFAVETEVPTVPTITLTERDYYAALEVALKRGLAFLWPQESESPSLPASEDDMETRRRWGSFSRSIVSTVMTPATRLSGRLPPALSAPPVESAEDILDWDPTITAPLPKRRGTIRARLLYGGRGKPIPVEDPWA